MTVKRYYNYNNKPIGIFFHDPSNIKTFKQYHCFSMEVMLNKTNPELIREVNLSSIKDAGLGTEYKDEVDRILHRISWSCNFTKIKDKFDD